MGDEGGKLGGLFWGFLTEIRWHRTDDIVGKHATRIATVWDAERCGSVEDAISAD